jgi:methionyl-tRNA formyltransferase
MRYVFFGNNQMAAETLEWLVASGVPPVGLCLHPASRSRHRDRLLSAAGLTPDAVFDGSTMNDQSTRARLAALRPALGLSILFDYVLRTELLTLFPKGVVNLHPSLLPYNRGQYPNVWSIVEGTPAGVTLHYMDEGIDTGDVIAQREVAVAPTDTGATLYQRLEEQGLELFRETWPMIVAGTASRRAQQSASATYHRTNDVQRIDEIDVDRSYRAGELLNILRARTFPPYDGAYVTIDGRRVYLRLELYERS